MNDEKKLSDDELKDVAGGGKDYNSTRPNSKVDKKDGDPSKGKLDSGPDLGIGTVTGVLCN
jgi:hypothetical protein